MTKKSLLFHPIFIISLLGLLLNDFVLKQAFGNAFTGKMSDFVGLIVFPVFIASIFPRAKDWVSALTAIVFIFWKTPWVTPLIHSINSYSPFIVQRTIDYTDYMALAVLPFVHIMISRGTFGGSEKGILLASFKKSLLFLSFFAICATSMPPPVEMPQGTVYIGKEYTIRRSKEETINMIKSLGYNVEYYENTEDSITLQRYSSRNIPYYQTDNIIIKNKSYGVDTIKQVKYTLHQLNSRKTKIEIINVTLTNSGSIQRWQTLKYMRKQYKKLLEKELIQEVQ